MRRISILLIVLGTCYSQTLIPSAPLHVARYGATATVLRNGLVLVSGGVSNAIGSASRAAEIFDPSTGAWRLVGAMTIPRRDHAAVLLNDGRVLIAGGQNDNEVTAATEIFDPSTESFSPSAPMATSRAAHAAVLLADGRVLVAGGVTKRLTTALTDTVEAWDPISAVWTSLAPLPRPGAHYTATLLPGGRVLAIEGYGERNPASSDVFAHDTSADVWVQMAPLSHVRSMHFALALPDGRLLVGGGADGDASLEWYDPAGTGRTVAGQDIVLKGGIRTAARLDGDEVLLVGLESVVPFNWRTGLAEPKISFSEPRLLPALAVLKDGSVLLTGGFSRGRVTGTVDRWTRINLVAGSSTAQAGGIAETAAPSTETRHDQTSAPVVLTPTSAQLPAAGGIVTVVVTPVSAAAWNAQVQSDSAWLSINGGATGSGNGSVVLQAGPNSSSTSRIGTVQIGNQQFLIRQLGDQSVASVTVDKTNLTFGENAGSSDVLILTDQTSGAAPGNGGASWFTVSILPPGTSGAVSLLQVQVAANSAASSRAGQASYGDAVINVVQAPQPAGYQNLLAGVVRDAATGQPIAGARLFFYGGGIAYATADSNGVYSLTGQDLQPSGGALSGELYVGAVGYFESSAEITDLSKQPSLPVIRDFLLQPGGAVVRGTVLDSVSNAPVAGATIVFTRSPMSSYQGGGTKETITTAADGTYIIDSSYFNESGLTAGFSVSIQANATGYLGATRETGTFSAYPITENILLTPTSGPLLRGRITDRSTGQPIAGARLFFYGSGIAHATADSNGVYSLTGQDLQSASGGVLSGELYVGAVGYFESSAEITDLSKQPSLPVIRDFLLHPGGAVVQGTVLDSVSNAPVAGATIVFTRSPMSSYQGGGTKETITTAADGTYIIDSSYFNESGLTAGFGVTIQANATGYLGATRETGTFSAYPITENILLTPTSGPLLRGRITDRSTGQPIAGARLFFYGSAIAYATADSNGVYSLTGQDLQSASGGVLSGELYVGAVGYFESSAEITDLSKQPSLPVIRDFLLHPGGAVVRGTVLDSGSNAPVAGATIVFTRSPMSSYQGGGTKETITTAADGTYIIDSSYFNESGLTAGFGVTIQANATGYLGATRDTGTFSAYPITENFALAFFVRLEPPSAGVESSAGSGTFDVALQGQYAGGSWTATSQSDWIQIDTSAGSVSYSVSANNTGQARTGQIRISTTAAQPNIIQSVGTLAARRPLADSPSTLNAFFTVTQTAALPPSVTHTVTSTPPGMTVSIDNVPYVTPKTVTWITGSNHTLSVVSPQITGGVKETATGWSTGDTTTAIRVTAQAVSTTYAAMFSTQYLLTVRTSGSGSVSVNPASADGYYSSGTSVQLTAVPSGGSQFAGWTGDLAGSTNPQSVAMTAPRTVTANFVALAPANIIMLSQATVPFVLQRGGTAPAQTVSIQTLTSSSVWLSYGPWSSWLKATPSISTTPANLVLSVDATGVASGFYSDQIYLSAPNAADVVIQVTLTVQDAVPAGAPSITSIDTPGGSSDIAQNGWIEIKGLGLAPATVGSGGITWDSAPEFASGKMPTQLGGVSVTINGKSAFVAYVSAAQMDVLAPLDNTVGSAQVVVTSSGVSSAPFIANMRPVVPSFPLLGNTKYIVAAHSDDSMIGPLTPARPGETILLYGFGFGLPRTGLLNGSSSQSGALPVLPTLQIGGVPATVTSADVISPGLYELKVIVPGTAQNGDNLVVCSYSGSATPTGDLIAIQH